jgi:AcrR family transcriptional regulator
MRPSVELERREQLTAAAARVIARKGYEAATVRDVAEEAGTSTGTIAYYYDGKDDLFAQTLVAASERFRTRMARAVDGLDDPFERLLAMAAAATPRTAPSRRSHALWIDFWAQAVREPAIRQLNERIYAHWRERIAETVREGQATGAFRADADPDEFARGFAAVVDGLATHVVVHPSVVSPDDMRSACRAFAAQLLA